MPWDVLLDDGFADWLLDQEQDVRREILGSIDLLAERGPHLGRPYVDTVEGSEYNNMKELRVQIAGNPWRVLFAFDPNRSAFILVGGNKGKDKRWYKNNIPIADRRFRQHLHNTKC